MENEDQHRKSGLDYEIDVEGDYFLLMAEVVLATLRRAGGMRFSELVAESNLADDGSRQLQP